MDIAFVIFDRMTMLDFAGVYDSLTRLVTMNIMEDLTYVTCSYTEKVTTFEGLEIVPDSVKQNLSRYDLVVIPGGKGVDTIIQDTSFMDWLATISPDSLIASVCTGSLILGAAQLLQNKKATTHRTAQTRLQTFCSAVVDDRVVKDGTIITARGVTASIDLGLYIVELLAGTSARELIQKQIDYESDYFS